MPNTFLTPSVIAREALMILESNMVMASLVDRGIQDDFQAAKVGDTIDVRSRASFVADEYDGTTQVIQDATETNVPVVLEKHFDVSFKVTDKQMSLDINNFGSQLLEPALVAIAESIDSYVCTKARTEAYNIVGTAGDPPDSLVDVAAIEKALNIARVPNRFRNYVMDPTAKADLFSIPSFAEADKRGDQGTALRDASMGRYMNLDMFMNQNIGTQVVGSLTANVTVSGTPAAGATTITGATDGGGAFNLVPGDIISIVGQTQTTFVVTAASGAVGASSSGSISISPALDTTAGGGEAITLAAGTDHVGNLAFHRDAIVLAAVPLEIPVSKRNSDSAAMIQNRGFGIRAIWDYDPNAKSDIISLDILCGVKVKDPRLLLRVLG